MFLTPIDDWLQQTRSAVYSRSEQLKALDNAIRDGNLVNDRMEEALSEHIDGFGYRSAFGKLMVELADSQRAAAVNAAYGAFEAWAATQAGKTNGWRDSSRNSSGAVTTLWKQLTYLRGLYPVPGTQEALNVIIEKRNQSIPVLFADCECLSHSTAISRLKDKYTRAKLVKNAAVVARDSARLAGVSRPSLPHLPHASHSPLSGASSASGSGIERLIKDTIDGLVRDAFGVVDAEWHHVEQELGNILTLALDGIKEELAALLPLVGAASSCCTAVKSTALVISRGLDADKLCDMSRRLEQGDSRAAMDSVRTWQVRDIAINASKAARATVNTGAHAAAILSGGGGTVAQLGIGIANAVAAMLEVIVELGVQYRQSRELTKYLNGRSPDAPFGRDMFSIAPLAGAYYLLNTPTSHIALQLVTIGAPGWRADVERLVSSGELKLLAEESARLIAASHYRIVPKSGTPLRDRMGKTLTMKAKDKLASAKSAVGIAAPSSAMEHRSAADYPALPPGD